MSTEPEFLEKYDFNLESYEEFISKPPTSEHMDDFGNLVLSANIDETNIKNLEKFIMKVPAKKKLIKHEQIELFMDTEVSEFADQTIDETTTKTNEQDIIDFGDEVEEEVRSQLQNESLLQTQLDELSGILDKEVESGVQFQEKSSENFAAAKDLIISQRISLGEGTTPSDFSDSFPFLPIDRDSEPQPDRFPFLSE